MMMMMVGDDDDDVKLSLFQSAVLILLITQITSAKAVSLLENINTWRICVQDVILKKYD